MWLSGALASMSFPYLDAGQWGIVALLTVPGIVLFFYGEWRP